MFKYDVTTTDGEEITVVLKDYGQIPGRVSRYNVGNIEGQVWSGLEWATVEPAHWPTDSVSPGHRIFDDIPQSQITALYNEWQKTTS